jgi:hypothetical protein
MSDKPEGSADFYRKFGDDRPVNTLDHRIRMTGPPGQGPRRTGNLRPGRQNTANTVPRAGSDNIRRNEPHARVGGR